MASSYIWTGADAADPTDWNDPRNWLVGGVRPAVPPGASDAVTISAGTAALAITGTGTLQSASLTLSAAAGGSVTLTGSYTTTTLSLTGLLKLQGTLAVYGTASFAAGAHVEGGTTVVSGAATFAGGFTLGNGALDLSTTTTATITTLTLIGATVLSGNVTATRIANTSPVSLTLGTGTLTVTSSSVSAPAALPALTIAQYAALVGAFTTPSITVLQSATLTLGAGDSLVAGTAAFEPSGAVFLTDGSLLITGDATLGSFLSVSGAGTATIDGTVATDGGSIQASSNSRVLIGGLTGLNGSILLSADQSSSIEIGLEGTATTGTVTIDAGIAVDISGSISAPGIVVNGSLRVQDGQALSLTGSGRGLTGSGTLLIGQGSSLALNGIDPGTSDLLQITYAATGGQLDLTTSDLNSQADFVPTISGFGVTDVLDFQDYADTVTSASYGGGLLDLYAGSVVVASVTIGAGYTDTFSVLAVNGGATYQIDYLGGGIHAAPAGTASPDAYRWVGPVAGAWNASANWIDVTTGHSPAIAPGANNTVTIPAAANGAAQVLIGNANAFGLTLQGETLLDGLFRIGAGGLAATNYASAVLYAGSTLAVTGDAVFSYLSGVILNGGAMTVTGTFYGGTYDQNVIEAGGSLTAGALVDQDSSFAIAAGSSVIVTGTVSDLTNYTNTTLRADGAGARLTVGGTFISGNDSVTATNGGQIQLARLAEDATGNGIYLYADAASSIEIGTKGSVALGTIKIDTGIALTERGTVSASTVSINGALTVGAGQSLNDNAALVLNGSLAIAAGGSLNQYGAITGTGTITLNAGAILTISLDAAGAAVPIVFAGSGGQLVLDTGDLNASNQFAAPISGFDATDVIDFQYYYGTITSAAYGSGNLTLFAGTTLVASFSIGAGYTDNFSVLPINGGSTYQIDYLGGKANPAPAGTSASDAYQWIGPVAGAWNLAANWSDTTTGQTPALVPPGAKNTITIPAAANGAAQVLIGNGNASALTLQGQTLLDGLFKIGAGGVTIGQYASAVLYKGSTLSITGNASLGYDSTVTLNGGKLSATGTVYGGSYGQNLIEAGGSFTAGAMINASSTYSIAAGSLLTITGTVSDAGPYNGSSVYANGAGAKFTVGGTFISGNDSVTATNGGQIQLARLAEDATGNGIYLYADAASSIEIGTKGSVALGTIKIDTGIALTERGTVSASTVSINGALTVGAGQSLNDNAALVLNGSLAIAAGGSLNQYGAITGTGTITLNAGAILTISLDAAGAAVPIVFAGSGGQLVLDTGDLNASNQFAAPISGFDATDVIDFQYYYGTITSAAYGSGNLTLFAGTTLVASFSIGAGYTDNFSVLPINGGSTYQIDYLGGKANPAPAGTSASDAYQWIGPVAGAWNLAANWSDTTTGQTPALVPPGAKNTITIPAAANGAAQVLIGNGNASALTLQGQTLLDGLFKIGAGGVTIGQYASAVLYKGSTLSITGNASLGYDSTVTLNGGKLSATGTVYGGSYGQNLIEAGGSLTAGAMINASSTYSIAAGSLLTITGTVSDAGPYNGSSVYANGAGAKFTVKGSLTSSGDSITVSGGAAAQLAGLAEDAAGGAIDLSVQDSLSSIEIGTKGAAALGAITIDAGIALTEAGYLSATRLIVNGALTVGAGQRLSANAALVLNGSLAIAAGGTLNQYGAITGTGTITLNAGALLDLTQDAAGSAVPIAFAGNASQLTLDTTDLNVAHGFASPLTGFNAADVIDFQDYADPITSAAYAGGTLTLYAGITAVAAITLGAGYTNTFSVLPVNGGSTYQIDYLGGGTNTAPAGTTAPDSYQWIGPVAGAWNLAANWSDTTTGQSPALLPPGLNNSVTIAAAANGAAQVLIGNGNAYGLTLQGQTLLDGVFKVTGTGARGGLSVGQYASCVLYAGSTLTISGDASFGYDAALILNGGKMSIAGTIYGAMYGQSLIEAGGSLTAAAMVDNRSNFTVAAGSAITISGNVSDDVASPYYSSQYTISGTAAKFTVKGIFVSSSDSVTASAGAQVQFAGLTEDSVGDGIYFNLQDSASSIEIGTKGAAALGAITIDPGITVTEGGSLSAPSFINNGTIAAAIDQSLTLYGALSGIGTLAIDSGATLSLNLAGITGTDSVRFANSTGTLALQNPLAYAHSEIYGFVQGDLVDLAGAWQFSSFSENVAGTVGTLTVTDGTNHVALAFAGAFTAGSFSIATGPTTVIGHS